jgi:hypothetical protein
MINRLEAGVYSIGESMSNQTIVGTRDRPIIFRAAQNASDPWGPPVRATINGSILSTHGHDHIWCEHGLVFPTPPGSEKPRAGRWWGVEVTDVGGSTATGEDWTGSGVATTTHDGGGNDVKFINLFIHDKYPHTPGAPVPKVPTAQGIGGGDDNDDCEFYGNIIFRNGWTNLDHGFYTQVTSVHTTKRWVDNLVFENSGEGFQIYGSAPKLQNIYFEVTPQPIFETLRPIPVYTMRCVD